MPNSSGELSGELLVAASVKTLLAYRAVVDILRKPFWSLRKPEVPLPKLSWPSKPVQRHLQSLWRIEHCMRSLMFSEAHSHRESSWKYFASHVHGEAMMDLFSSAALGLSKSEGPAVIQQKG